MALNFPSSPALNQTHTVGSKTWKWNGYAWDVQINISGGGADSAFVVATSTTANTALNVANSAFAQANTGTSLAQAAYNYANTIVSDTQIDPFARSQANSAYAQANTATTNAATANNQAVSAFSKANTATTLAQSAYDFANTIVSDTQIDPFARSIANSAFAKANTSVTYNQNLNTSNTVSFAGVTVTGNTTVQHVVPSANVTYDLGTPTARFRDLYLSGNTINLGGAQISANGSAITLPAQTKIGNKNLTFEEISTIAIDTEIASSDGGLNINKLTRYRDLRLSSFSENTISSLSTTAFNTVYSISEERFNTTIVCDNATDIFVTLPSSNTIVAGFNVTLTRLNSGDITVQTSPDANDSIRYGGWRIENLKVIYMKDRQLSEFQNAKFTAIPTLNNYPPASEFDGKYTFKYIYIGNSSYMLSI